MPSGPTRATVLLDDGPVTILPKRAPVGNSGPIRGHTLAVFPLADGAAPATVDVPGDVAAVPGDTADVPVQRPRTFQATIEPSAQPAFALLDLDERDAVALGRSLGLAVILFWDGRRAGLLSCDGS